jgi:hypothetical protein
VKWAWAHGFSFALVSTISRSSIRPIKHPDHGFDPTDLWAEPNGVVADRVALAAHDEMLGGAIEAPGGWFFKHTGDGGCRVNEPSADRRTGRYTHQHTSGSPTKGAACAAAAS